MWAPPQASTPAYRSVQAAWHALPAEAGLVFREMVAATLPPLLKCPARGACSLQTCSPPGPARGGTVPRTGWCPPALAQDGALARPEKEQAEGGRGRLPEQCAPGGGAEVPAGVWPCPPEGQPPGHGASQGNRGGWSGLSCAEGGSRIAPHCGHHRTAGRGTTGHRTAGRASRKPHPRTPHPQAGRRHPRYL